MVNSRPQDLAKVPAASIVTATAPSFYLQRDGFTKVGKGKVTKSRESEAQGTHVLASSRNTRFQIYHTRNLQAHNN